MYVLVLNAGSSSVKYQLFDMATSGVLAKGLCERIGIDGRLIHKVPGKEDYISESPLATHSQAIKSIVDTLASSKNGVIDSMDQINAIGHRGVHGGTDFPTSTLVTPEVIKLVESLRDLAPLHTDPILMGIRGCLEYMPRTPQVIVFDTSFHQTMPCHVYSYAIPRELGEKYKIRRYGFHGTSHYYVSKLANEVLAKNGKNPDETKIVTCHLGNGSSVTAVKGGKTYDTSMGLTPLEGIIMGTRTGSMDPAIVPMIMEKEGLSAAEVTDFLNKKCGLLGISGISSDMREVSAAKAAGDENAILAIDMLGYSIKKYIGAYAAAMGGLDAIVFTAGIGENNPGGIREISVAGLEFLGAKIDMAKNAGASSSKDPVVDISTNDSTVKIFVIPTNEELVIASDTAKVIGG